MNPDEIRKRFPNASEAFIRANASDDRAGAVAIVERAAGNAPVAKDQGEEGHSGKLLIRFESVRKRLCDPDNIAVKWLLDALRYSGAIPGDEPEKIAIEVAQRKCGKDEAEHTVLEIHKL